jgi:hypothetical protein
LMPSAMIPAWMVAIIAVEGVGRALHHSARGGAGRGWAGAWEFACAGRSMSPLHKYSGKFWGVRWSGFILGHEGNPTAEALGRSGAGWCRGTGFTPIPTGSIPASSTLKTSGVRPGGQRDSVYNRVQFFDGQPYIAGYKRHKGFVGQKTAHPLTTSRQANCPAAKKFWGRLRWGACRGIGGEREVLA